MALNSAQLIGTGLLDGFRNRIINGDMRIAQRGVPQTLSAAGYVIDRWNNGLQGGGAYSVNQSTDVPTAVQAETAFTNSMLVTVTTADASIAAGDFYWPQHRVEGYNISDAGFGTAGAKPLTLSFWVKSSLSGTYALGVINNGQTRSYGTTYTVNAANTWEHKKITIPGDTGGTWSADNNIGVVVVFPLGGGTSFTAATPGSWTSTAVNIIASAATRSSNTASAWVATLGATWQVTGVQLEKGSVATEFERRSYGTELALCQRYYLQANRTNGSETILSSYHYNTVYGFTDFVLPTPVSMRATPTIVTPPTQYIAGNSGAAASFTAALTVRGICNSGVVLRVLQALTTTVNIIGDDIRISAEL